MQTVQHEIKVDPQKLNDYDFIGPLHPRELLQLCQDSEKVNIY